MRSYELVAIISPAEDDSKVSDILGRIAKFISDRGGAVDEVNQWGKRKLAYPIRKFLEGNYILTRFKLEPKSVKELEAQLRGSEEILRHLVVKLDE